MPPAYPDEIECWLSQDGRASLPFLRLVRLYLDPFALFKDASRGPPSVRQRAMTYNRSMRWMLLTYMRRWLVIAACLFLVISPAEAVAAQAMPAPLMWLPACAAVACCVSVTVMASAAAAYLMLGLRR